MMRMQYWRMISRSVSRIVLMTLFGIGMWSVSAQAAITLQSFTEPVEVQFQGGNWVSVSESVELSAGDVIATGKGGTAELLFEDGSTVVLESETQLAIRDLEFSEAEEVRVSRLKLLWGKIMGKATPLTYKTNVFEVETNTALAGFKFSAATIETQPGGGSCGGIPGPCSTLSDFEGQVDVVSTSAGTTVTLSPGGDSEAAVTFTLPPGTTVNTQTDPATGRVSFTSSGLLTQATIALSSQNNAIAIGNATGNSPLDFMAGGHEVNMGQNSNVTIGFAQSDADLQPIAIDLGSGTFSFDFSQDTTITPGRVSITANQGIIAVDGRPLLLGVTYSFEATSPAPAEERTESFTIPPVPLEPPADPVGSPVLP